MVVWKKVDSIEVSELMMKVLGESVENWTHKDMVYVLDDEKKLKNVSKFH